MLNMIFPLQYIQLATSCNETACQILQFSNDLGSKYYAKNKTGLFQNQCDIFFHNTIGVWSEASLYILQTFVYPGYLALLYDKLALL